MKRKIFLVITIIFAGIFAVSAFMLYRTIHGYQEAKAIYSDLRVRYVTPAKPKVEQGSSGAEEPKETAPVSVDFDALLADCGDVVGWLYSEDTPIDYPVVQSYDNDYYLRRDLSGNYLNNGTLFVDFRCAPVGKGQNYIIYGHNMKDGSMFGTLPKYKGGDYFSEHPVLYYLTPEKDYKIELFAAMVTSSDSESYTPEFGDAEEFEAYLQRVIEKSTFTSDVAVTGEDHVITLSTCSYEFGNARYVMLGKLTELSR